MIILFSLLILLVLFILYNVFEFYRLEKLMHNIPGPKALPIIGNTFFLLRVHSMKDMFVILKEKLAEISRYQDDIAKCWLGPKLIIFLSNPEYIEALLNDPHALEKDFLYKIIGLAGNGVFARNGKIWKELRKPLNKFFTKKLNEERIPIFHRTAMTFCDVLQKYCRSGEDFNVKDYSVTFNLDSLAVTNFGYEINELQNNRYDYSTILQKAVSLFIVMIAKPECHINLSLAKLTKRGKKLMKYAKKHWQLVNEMLEGRIMSKKNISSNEKFEFYSDVVIQKAKELKLNKEERSNLITDFLLAGTDSTAVMTSYIFLMLAMYPEHQDAVYQEQLVILGKDPEVIPTWEQLSQMTYLTRVVKEVLRLYCPLAIFRKITKNFQFGEYILPKGATVGIAFFRLHRNPKYWSHPDQFYPDHFLPENVATRPMGCYLPFSSGARGCPGEQYSHTSIKTLISVAIRRYKLNTDMKYDNLEYEYSLFLESAEGYMIRIENRE